MKDKKSPALPLIKAFSIAGFDGSGGAGITSDAKIFSKLGIYGLSAVTAVTAQNPDKIYKIKPVSKDVFEFELRAVFDYFKVDCVKTGLVSNEEQSELIARYISVGGVGMVVVDPVFISTSGKKLNAAAGKGGLNFLIPLFNIATAITPNIPEAELIAKKVIKNVDSMKTAALSIRRIFPQISSIVIKGSHLGNDVITDIALDYNNEFFIYERKRIKMGKEIHGTGCAFSAVLAAYLAKGANLNYALVKAETFVEKIISRYKFMPDNKTAGSVYITANV